MKFDWNPMTADEPDPYEGLKEEAIERKAESLMIDESWVETILEDGRLGEHSLVYAVARGDVSTVGTRLLDILWTRAYAAATDWIENGGDCDGND